MSAIKVRDRVTFTDRFAAILLRQAGFSTTAASELRAEIEAGFDVTRVLPNGRINVTMMRGGTPSYRTFSPRDLRVMA